MEKEVARIAVCGSVDHGKSTLLGRLLWDTHSLPEEKILELKRISGELRKGLEPAFLVDCFKEEREEERTIDTTQVFFSIRKRRYCLIDTPGHVEFIKNMMTGATQADAALLLVDVKEGICEQTRRHARLLGLLGISQVIVIINKMDLAGFDKKKFEQAKDEILLVLDLMGIEPKAVIPVSARDGDNILKLSRRMKWYRGSSVAGALGSLERKAAGLPALRFPIQDVYEIGAEVICVGRVESGKVAAGQKVVVLPGGSSTEVIAVKVFGAKKDAAYAGENIGLILKDAGRKRGEVICSQKNVPITVTHFDGNVFWLSDKPLKPGDRVTLRCATQETKGKVEFIRDRMDSSTLTGFEKDSRSLKKTELATVSFSTHVPLVLEKFEHIKELGRFIIEDRGVVCGFGIKQ